MKHGEGKEEARELYCYQQMTFDEIAKRVGRSEKTIRSWAEAGNWKQERYEVVRSQSSTRDKLHVLVDNIAIRLTEDAKNGVDMSPQSLHALASLVGTMNNMYKYERTVKNEEPEAAENKRSPEELAAKVAEIMGA
jgi:predicted transcriptional regulator